MNGNCVSEKIPAEVAYTYGENLYYFGYGTGYTLVYVDDGNITVEPDESSSDSESSSDNESSSDSETSSDSSTGTGSDSETSSDSSQPEESQPEESKPSDSTDNSGTGTTDSNSSGSGSTTTPDTGVAGISMTLGIVALAGAAVVISRKKTR